MRAVDVFAAEHGSLVARRPWMEQAACRGQDPDRWFKRPYAAATAEAATICRGCPVRDDCLAWALEFEEHVPRRYGVFGGLGPNEREALFRQRKANAA